MAFMTFAAHFDREEVICIMGLHLGPNFLTIRLHVYINKMLGKKQFFFENFEIKKKLSMKEFYQNLAMGA